MEATALSIGKSVLNGALSYAKSALAEEVALQLGVRRDQLFITNELEMMQAFLMAAHDEGVDNMVVKVWVKQVRDVAYDVEDTLQEFAVRLEKKSWWRIRRTLLDRRRVAKQMKELRANVEDVSQRNTRYNLIKGSSTKPATAADQLAITGETMSGIDEARRQWNKAKVDLVRLINKKDDDLRVIAVSGTRAGELGEMSVIKRAYEDPKIRKKFDYQAWITGLKYPLKLTELLRSIIEQFHLNFLQVSQEKQEPTLELQVLRNMGMIKEDDLVDEFMRFMNEKSYLIVLSGPPLPPACCGLAPSGCAYAADVSPAFPDFPWAPPPRLPARRCSITEIDESPRAEVEDNFSPRSVLTPWRRATPVSPPPPPPPLPPSLGAGGTKPAFDPNSDKTSLMICNIPNSFAKRRFMAILDQHCAQENDNPEWRVVGGGKFVRSEYDFLYLPIDFRRKFNKGYAFVNMTTPTAARRLHAFLHGHSWVAVGSAKVCEVVHADIQGVDALSKHFSCSRFPCGGNKDYLPVRFGPPRDGVRPTVERVIGRAVARPR